MTASTRADTPEARLRRACAELDKRLRCGENIRAEAFLEAEPALAGEPDSAIDLIYAEYIARLELGQQALTEEFYARFPQWRKHLEMQFAFHEALKDEALADAAEPPLFPRPSSGEAGPADWPKHYEILGELGRGGMGVVYKARQASLNRTVALKMILPGSRAGPEELARFRTEAEVVARLRHPNIVQIYDVGDLNGCPFLALEFVDGGTLHEHQEGRPFPPRAAAELVETLARAVHTAHEAGVVHRDLKPSNILLAGVRGCAGVRNQESGAREDKDRPSFLTPDSWLLTPKITDFGLAKCLLQESVTPNMTATGVVVGTPSYMAPEQAGGHTRQVGPAADVYALGAILYELLTGRPPFHADTPLATLEMVCTREPVSLRRLQPGVPRDLETICLKCLHKEVPQRYASAHDLADDLGRFARGEPVRARPARAAEKVWRWCRRHPAPATAAVLAGILLLAASLAPLLWGYNERWHGQQLAGEKAETEKALQQSQDNYRRLQEADRTRRLALRQSADLALGQGVTLGEQGEPGQALLWLAHALDIATRAEADDLALVARRNLSGFRDEVHPLRAALVHESTVLAAAFSPDGKLLATADYARAVRLWDAHTGQPVGGTLPHTSAVNALAFAPNGKTLVSGGQGNSVWIWEVPAGRLRAELPRIPQGRRSFAFSPDGTKVAVAYEKPQVGVWAVADGRLLHQLTHTRGPVSDIVFAADGTLWSLGSVPGKEIGLLQGWDADTGLPRGGARELPGAFSPVGFSSDGQWAATRSRDGQVRAWSVATAAPLGPPLQHPSASTTVAFSGDGRRLLTAGADHAACLWDPREGRLLATPVRHRDDISHVLFSPNGRLGLTTSYDGTARLFDVATGRPLGSPLPHTGRVVSAAFSPDSRAVVTTGVDRVARLWEVREPAPLAVVLDQVPGAVSSVASPDLRAVAIELLLDTTVLYDSRTGRAFDPPWRYSGRLHALAFDARGERFATVAGPLVLHRPGAVLLWDASTGRQVCPPLQHPSSIFNLAFSPDGTTLATATYTGEVRFFEAATGQPTGPTLRMSDRPYALAFRPDGAALAYSAVDKTIRVWDVRTGQPVAGPFLHPDLAPVLTFSPDGTTLATGCTDRTVRLWNVAAARPRGDPWPQEELASCLAFSPDGRTLAIGDQRGTLRLWDVATGRPAGPPRRGAFRLQALAFHPDGRSLMAGHFRGSVWTWAVPEPLAGTVEELIAEAEVLTGMFMGPGAIPRVLDAPSWDRRQRLLNTSHRTRK